MRKAASIKLTDDERHSLTKLANGRRTEVRVAMRAKVVLAAARGQENRAIAKDWTRPPFKVWLYLASALASVMFVLVAAHAMSHS